MKLKEAIYAQAVREEKLRVPYQQASNIFHVHEAGYCTLRTYLDKLPHWPSEKEENDGRVNMLLADGHMHQTQLTSYIQRAPNMHVTNVEEDRVLMVDNIVIVGHPDAIIYDMKEKQRWVLEIKSLGQYNGICREGTKNVPAIKDDDIEGLKAGYHSAIPQTRLLCKMFDTYGGIVLVKNKNTSELKEFHIERDDKLADKVIEKFIKISQMNSAPACDYIKGDKRCFFCKYPSMCGSGK